MSNGIQTTLVDEVQSIDEVIGNAGNRTARFGIGQLISLITAKVGPSYKTRTTLFEDLDWPEGAVGTVFGDGFEERNGVYRKSGQSGQGDWTRIGDLPISQSVRAALAEERDARLAADSSLQELIGSLTQGFRAPQLWEASSGAFPAGAQVGDLYRTSSAGVVDGQSFTEGQTLLALVDNPSTSIYDGNWQVGELSDLLASLTVQDFKSLAELVSSPEVLVGQRAQISGLGEYDIVAADTFAANGTTVIDLPTVSAQAVSTSRHQEIAFTEETRTIEFLREIFGSGSVVAVEFAGHAYDLELDQLGSGPEYVTCPSGVKLRVKYTDAGKLPLDAFGVDKEGSVDALAAFNQAISMARADGRVEIDCGGGTLRLSADPTNYKFVYTIGHGLEIVGGTTSDFAINDNTLHYVTTPAAAGSVGGGGNNASWMRKFSGSPAAIVMERTDVPGQPIVFGRLQANHDGMLVTADARKALIFGVNDAETDEGCFVGLTIKKDSVIFNGGRRNVDTFFYTQDDTQSLFVDGQTGAVRIRRSSGGDLTIQGLNAGSYARVYFQTPERAWSMQAHSTQSFRISDQTGVGAVFILSKDLAVGALTMEGTGELHLQGLPTEKLKIKDAGLTGGTEDGWISINIGGQQKYIRVHNGK